MNFISNKLDNTTRIYCESFVNFTLICVTFDVKCLNCNDCKGSPSIKYEPDSPRGSLLYMNLLYIIGELDKGSFEKDLHENMEIGDQSLK